MHCPFCSFADTKVVDSRTVEEAIRRRRECLRCGARFSTFERVEAPAVMVVKKDGRREEFNREKILSGVRRACEKRPLDASALSSVVARVQTVVHGLGQSEVQSSYVGELVMHELREIDQIAYVRFASVYRQFADIDSIRDVLDELERSGAASARPREQLPLLPAETMEGLERTTHLVPLPPRLRRRPALLRSAEG